MAAEKEIILKTFKESTEQVVKLENDLSNTRTKLKHLEESMTPSDQHNYEERMSMKKQISNLQDLLQ